MPIKVLDLGDLQVTSRNSKQSLLLASSITLEIPTSIDEQISLSDLTDMTKDGQLWIAKAATSRLEVAASVQGVQLDGGEGSSDLRQYMVDAIFGCPIWDDLTLKLRKEAPKFGDEAQPDAYTSFVINHPDLSSDLLSPKDIPCAKLLAVTCDICYGQRPRRKPAERQTKRRKIDRPERTQVQAEFGLRRKPRPSYRESDSNDREEDEDERETTKRRKAPSLKSQDSGIGLGSQEAIRPEQNGSRDLRAEELRTDVALLIRAALNKLLGTKKVTSGVRVARDLTGSCLIDIAPAVFNIRYLQAFASRAEHIPWIASCLSSLDAESPSLRTKIRSLTADPDADTTAGLEKRLHMLVQRSLDVAPIAPSNRRAGARVAEQHLDEDLSQQSEPGLEQDLESWSQNALISQQREPAFEHDSLEPWSQDALIDSQLQEWQVENIADESPNNSWHNSLAHTNKEGQQQFGGVELEQPRSRHFSQPGNEWLDLSQARYILDEHGQRIAFEDLDHEEYSYELVPLGSDDLPV